MEIEMIELVILLAIVFALPVGFVALLAYLMYHGRQIERLSDD